MEKKIVKTKEEASEVSWKIFELKQKLSNLEEPLEEWNKEQNLLAKKEKYENKVFHNPRGSGIIYVQEVTKYDCRCIVLNSDYSGYDNSYRGVVGHIEYGAQFIVNVAFSFDELYNTSEWVGVGNRDYLQLVEQVGKLKEFFIDKNKSI